MTGRRLRACVAAILWVALLALFPCAIQAQPNYALDLDGDGDYVHLPGGVFAGLEEATIEAWVR